MKEKLLVAIVFEVPTSKYKATNDEFKQNTTNNFPEYRVCAKVVAMQEHSEKFS